MANELFKKIANLSDNALRKELSKFPNVESLRRALKGYMSAAETRANSKEKLIDKVFERKRRSKKEMLNYRGLIYQKYVSKLDRLLSFIFGIDIFHLVWEYPNGKRYYDFGEK